MKRDAIAQSSLEDFLARYAAASPERKQAALIAAGQALLQPVAEERLHTLAAIARHYGINSTTAWRWQLPHREWLGRKRYTVSDCEVYFASKQFKMRLAELRRKRRAARSPKMAKSGRGGGVA